MIEKLRGVVALAMFAGVLLAIPGADAQVDTPLRVSENRRLGTSDALARGEDVVGLAVNPNDPNHVVEVDEDFINGRCTYQVSFDAGVTWSVEGTLTAPPDFEGPVPCSRFDAGDYAHLDGSVAFGTGQNVYTAFSWNRPGEGDSTLVARSTDGGRTFETAVVAISGQVELNDPGAEGFIRPKLAVEARPEGDRVYVASWRLTLDPGGLATSERRAVTAVSHDGGLTWSAPVDAQAPTDKARDVSAPAIGPGGEVYVSYHTQGIPANLVRVAKSVDQGATWTQSTVDTVAASRDSFSRLAVDPLSGHVYIVYQDRAFDATDRDIVFQRSTDGGTTWSSPLRVNDDPLGTRVEQKLPNIDIAPDGQIDVVWHDRRHQVKGVAGAEEGDTYYAFSTDGGVSFSANRRITDRTINNNVGLDGRIGTYNFYTPAIASLDSERVLFAWADSREGDFNDDTQDIYLATLRAQETLPTSSPLNAKAPTADTAMSQLAFPGGVEATPLQQPTTRPVIVNENDVAGALAGGVLARAGYGPVLLSPASGLPQAVKVELNRLQPTGIFMIGGEDDLSTTVLKQLRKLLRNTGVSAEDAAANTIRLDGGSPAGTAAVIAGSLDRRTDADKTAGVKAFDAAVIANPDSPEAATASAMAASLQLPVLFVGADAIPGETTDALAALAIDKTLVIGGTAAVSDAVMAGLPAPTRLGGGDIVATSTAVAAESIARGVPTNIAYVTDADTQVAETAAVGAAVARLGGLLLVAPDAESNAVAPQLDALGLSDRLDRLVLLE